MRLSALRLPFVAGSESISEWRRGGAKNSGAEASREQKPWPKQKCRNKIGSDLFSVSGSVGRIAASKFRHFATTHLIDRTLPDIRRGITSKSGFDGGCGRIVAGGCGLSLLRFVAVMRPSTFRTGSDKTD
jgi:hypothetical protein